MNKKYFYKYAISKQQQIQKESNHLFQVARGRNLNSVPKQLSLYYG